MAPTGRARPPMGAIGKGSVPSEAPMASRGIPAHQQCPSRLALPQARRLRLNDPSQVGPAGNRGQGGSQDLGVEVADTQAVDIAQRRLAQSGLAAVEERARPAATPRRTSSGCKAHPTATLGDLDDVGGSPTFSAEATPCWGSSNAPPTWHRSRPPADDLGSLTGIRRLTPAPPGARGFTIRSTPMV